MLYGCIYGRGSLGVKVGGPSERTRRPRLVARQLSGRDLDGALGRHVQLAVFLGRFSLVFGPWCEDTLWIFTHTCVGFIWCLMRLAFDENIVIFS